MPRKQAVVTQPVNATLLWATDAFDMLVRQVTFMPDTPQKVEILRFLNSAPIPVKACYGRRQLESKC